MKKYRQLIFVIIMLGLACGWQVANAAVFRSCQGLRVGSVKLRFCQAQFRPGPRWWGPGPYYWRGPHPYWGRRVVRCRTHFTPWGPVRNCVAIHR